jgi:hypothetical protein
MPAWQNRRIARVRHRERRFVMRCAHVGRAPDGAYWCTTSALSLIQPPVAPPWNLPSTRTTFEPAFIGAITVTDGWVKLLKPTTPSAPQNVKSAIKARQRLRTAVHRKPGMRRCFRFRAGARERSERQALFQVPAAVQPMQRSGHAGVAGAVAVHEFGHRVRRHLDERRFAGDRRRALRAVGAHHQSLAAGGDQAGHHAAPIRQPVGAQEEHVGGFDKVAVVAAVAIPIVHIDPQLPPRLLDRRDQLARVVGDVEQHHVARVQFGQHCGHMQ